MRKILALLLTMIFMLWNIPRAFAVQDPLSVPNNKFGIHILFSSELQHAAQLVNTSGGDWGYVVIPIQSGDHDIKKWQAFMDQARQYHLIPIVRLATEGDYFNTSVWRKPNFNDILDFANFLNSLNWPTKNRYVIVYNEVNRDDEWGGSANASEYAAILSYAVTAFKSKSQDFFIISAGMDNAAANSSTAINEYTFFSQMNQAIPGIFNQIDGIASHSYPNPGFNQPPTILTQESISSYKYEKQEIEQYASKSLPVFITETGWTRASFPDATIGGFFQAAFSNVWNDPSIVTVAPFLLTAGGGPFANFSILSSSLSDTPIATAIEQISKTKGTPLLNPIPKVLAAEIKILPIKNFGPEENKKPNMIAQTIKTFFRNLFQAQARM